MDLSEMRNIRLAELVTIMAIGKSSVYQLITSGLLPPPIHMTKRCSTWPLHEVRAIMSSRAARKSDEDIRVIVCDMMKARQAGGPVDFA